MPLVPIIAALAAVTSTAELCDDFLQGGQGEPDFCPRAESLHTVETPYFSVKVPTSLIYGVSEAGTKFQAQPSIRQELHGFQIEYGVPARERRRTSGPFYLCAEITTDSGSWEKCERRCAPSSVCEMFDEPEFYRVHEGYLVRARYHRTIRVDENGSVEAEFEAMLQSIVLPTRTLGSEAVD